MATSPKKKLSQRFMMRHSPSFYIAYAVLITLCTLISAFIIVDQQKNLKEFMEFYTTREPNVYVQNGDTKGVRTAASSAFVKAVSILGERNSGTTWMYEHLNECFNHTLPVGRRLTRYKHWFQDENVATAGHTVDETLVIAMFRNPFEWVEAMRKRPHHASEHLSLDWHEFVTKPWTMDRVGLDLAVSEEEKNDPKLCQEAFLFRDIISCHIRPYPPNHFDKSYFSNHQPFYEMRNDGSGAPFDDILEMRAAKNYNFLTTKDYRFVKQLWVVHYEEMLSGGTEELIRNIEDITGVKSSCKPSPPQRRKRRPIGRDEMKYLKDHLDWDAEEVIGYTRTGMLKPTGKSTIYMKFVSK